MAHTSNSSDKGLTLSVLGCGTLGTAILSGILDSVADSQPSSETDTESLPSKLPTRFNTCIKRPESGKRLKSELSAHASSITVFENDNVAGVKDADVVILACKPWMVTPILSAPGIKDALQGKLLLSILAGVPLEQIEGVLYPHQSHEEIISSGGATVVRVMPSTASKVRESMTVIATSNPPLPSEQAKLVDWIFTRVGKVTHLPPNQMDACTALCGSGPAFMALVLEGLADGAVAMGVPRAEAQMMAAQTMRGTTGLVQSGEHPAILRERVSTPGGCTIGGSLVLEEAGVRGTIARAVREATVVASQLGKGVQGVNGTRW